MCTKIEMGRPFAWCPWCKGTGHHTDEVIDGAEVAGWDCWLCKGGGRVSLWRWLRLKFSWLIRTEEAGDGK